VLGIVTVLVPGVILGGWSLSVSTFGMAFAISYGITARLRGASLLKSLNVGRELRSARRLASALLLGLAVGGASGLFGVLAFVIHGGGLGRAVEFGALGVFTSALVVTPLAWLTGVFAEDPALGDTDPTGPVQAWRGDFLLWFVVGTVLGLASGVTSWLAYREPIYGIAVGHVSPFVEALAGGLAMGLAWGVILGRAWLTTVTQIWFAVRYRTPLRLGRFLDDSRHRHLLRTIGPIYQFRHATLQDHLGARSPMNCEAQQHQHQRDDHNEHH